MERLKHNGSDRIVDLEALDRDLRPGLGKVVLGLMHVKRLSYDEAMGQLQELRPEDLDAMAKSPTPDHPW